MQRRKLIIPLVALATMALMLSATGANAKPHETVGEIVGNCVVDGSVELTPGLDNNPSSNHYEFQDSTLECTSLDAKLDGTYDVTAEGDTADYWHHDGTDPNKEAIIGGEDCEQGGSDKVGDEVHTGVLFAEATDPAVNNDLEGKVHFVRLGTVVLADGPLWIDEIDQNRSEDLWFQAALQFTPNPPPPEQDCSKEAPVETADLDGDAVIYAGNSIHDCNLDSQKVSDKDCDL